MEKELLVFVKNPVAGKVKTRLAKDIGNENALKIYRLLLEHTLKVCQNSGVVVSICFSESISEEIASRYPGFNYYVQKGNDLGARMENAFTDAFRRGSSEVIIIGSDLYELEEGILRQAFTLLQHKDAVIGPAHDGGYYLLGLKTIPEGVFEKKAWGGNTIFRSTLNNLKGYDVALLRELNDIDLLDDLEAYPELMNYLKTGNYGNTT